MSKYSIPFTGFYSSSRDAAIDDAIEQAYSNGDAELFPDFYEYIHDHIDYGKIYKEYSRHYALLYTDQIRELLEPYGYITAFDYLDVELHSPREYNFETDKIFVNITDDVLRVLYKATLDLCEREFNDVCSSRHMSRSGFISFYNPVWQTWADDVTEWESPQVESMIIALMNHLHGDAFDVVDIYDDAMRYKIDAIVDSACGNLPPDVMVQFNTWRDGE